MITRSGSNHEEWNWRGAYGLLLFSLRKVFYKRIQVLYFLSENIDLQDKKTYILRLIKRVLCKWFGFSCPANINIKINLEKETNMGLVYRLFLSPPEASDVVKRVVSLKVDGNSSLLDINPNSTSYDLPPVKDNSLVEISVKDVDDAGNESGWSDPLKFTALDTIVPGTPQGLAVKLVAEVADTSAPEPPAPHPVVEQEAPTIIEAEAVVEPLATVKKDE